jgi:flagellar export protein FliJ
MAQTPFRFTSLLGYRAARLDQEVQRLARITTTLENVETGVAQVAEQQQQTLDGLLQEDRFSAAALADASAYLGFLEQRDRELQRQRAELRRQKEQARSALLKSHQDVEVLERLRERYQEAADTAEAHAEQRNLDEIASLRGERGRIA